MEELLNEVGFAGAGAVLVLIALPLTAVGLVVRRRGRLRAAGLALSLTARRALGGVTAGPVVLRGRWRALEGEGGILEEPNPAAGPAVWVARAPGAPAILDGAQVLVVGRATRLVDDPRQVGYRGERIWRVDASGPDDLVTEALSALERKAAFARLHTRIGALLFSAGIALAVAASLIAYRSAIEDVASMGSPGGEDHSAEKVRAGTV